MPIQPGQINEGGHLDNVQLLDLVSQARTRFFADPESAEALIEVGESPVSSEFEPIEQASFAVLGSVLLNLDEAITNG